ncbi:hypothetical protein LINPERPRIM_LOCUS13180 [Linum perenne]
MILGAPVRSHRATPWKVRLLAFCSITNRLPQSSPLLPVFLLESSALFLLRPAPLHTENWDMEEL